MEAGTPSKGGQLDRYGCKRTNVGGRSKVPAVLRRGNVKGKANRREPGQGPRRTERDPMEKLQMAQKMKELLKEYDDSKAGREAYWSKVLEEYQWETFRGTKKDKKNVLRKIRDQEDRWKREVEELELGCGYGAGRWKRGKHLAGSRAATGKRRSGAGVKNKCSSSSSSSSRSSTRLRGGTIQFY